MAICFLFSFLNPDHEMEAEQIVREILPGAYVSASHAILPQIKEFDRLSTTSLNAYVGPSLSSYLERLETRLSEAGGSASLFVIQVQRRHRHCLQTAQNRLSGPSSPGLPEARRERHTLLDNLGKSA